MCYQTKRDALQIYYQSTMCIYDRSKLGFDRAAKMKLTGHFDWICPWWYLTH